MGCCNVEFEGAPCRACPAGQLVNPGAHSTSGLDRFMRNPNAHFPIRHGRMTRASGRTNRDRKNAQDWSIMDVEDLRDFAKTVTMDDRHGAGPSRDTKETG
jgi:hypothetical protein